jgi:hypothetical protein
VRFTANSQSHVLTLHSTAAVYPDRKQIHPSPANHYSKAEVRYLGQQQKLPNDSVICCASWQRTRPAAHATRW